MVATGGLGVGEFRTAGPSKAVHRTVVCTLLLVVQAVVVMEISPGGAAQTAHPHSDHASAVAELDMQGAVVQAANVSLRNATLQARVAILDAMISMRSHTLARMQAAAGDSTATAAVTASLAAVAAGTSSAAAWEALADAHAMSGYVL